MDKTTLELREKKKIKLFNKVYTDMQSAINSSLKMKSKIHTISKYNTILNFQNQVDSNYKLYESLDEELFKKCTILEKILSCSSKISPKNKEVVWKYIQSLYSLVKEKKEEVALIPKTEGLNDLIQNLINNENSGIKSIIEDISSQMQQVTVGKDIDENTLIKDLLAGNLKSSGIDFQKIIEDTSKNIQERINNGDIDGENLHKTAETIKKSLGL